MMCQLVIDLSKLLCTKSSEWTKFVQREKVR